MDLYQMIINSEETWLSLYESGFACSDTTGLRVQFGGQIMGDNGEIHVASIFERDVLLEVTRLILEERLALVKNSGK